MSDDQAADDDAIGPFTTDMDRGDRSLGVWAFGLGAFSTAFYYGSSEGLRNFLAFVGAGIAKAMRVMGHGL